VNSDEKEPTNKNRLTTQIHKTAVIVAISFTQLPTALAASDLQYVKNC